MKNEQLDKDSINFYRENGYLVASGVGELYGNGVIPKNGYMVLSDRPGLGIELNEDTVARLTVS